MLLRDLRLALRRLAASPAFTIFSIATLALAIGVTTAFYSVIERLLDRHVGAADQSKLVDIHSNHSSGAALSWPDYSDVTAQQRSLTHLAAWARRMTSVGSRDESALTFVEVVTGNYFETTGGRLLFGRPLTPADDQSNAPPAVVLSENIWRTQFSSDPDILGRAVILAGQPVAVIGVADATFRGLSGAELAAGAWIPLALARRLPGLLAPEGFDVDDRQRNFLRVAGRLDPSTSREQASEDIKLIGERLDAAYPRPSDTPQFLRWRNWSIEPAFPPRSDLSNLAWALVLLPAMVFLVACTNLANLAISRGASRRGSMAVRQALGAPRWRLVREEAAEAALLAMVGGLAGLAVARVLLTTGLGLLQSHTAMPAFALPLDLALSPAVLLPVLATTILSLVMGGLLPAIQLSKNGVRETLAVDAETAVPRWRGRSRLITLQVAASVALFLTAFAASRALVALRAPYTDLALDGTAVAVIPFDQQQYDESRAREVVERLVLDLQRQPGMQVAASGGVVATGTGSTFNRVSVTMPPNAPDGAASPQVVVASPDFFRVVGLPLVRGRAFSTQDTAGAPRVAIIDESLAQELFGSPAAAVGSALSVRVETPMRAPRQVDATIAGVVPSSRFSLSGIPVKQIYLPFAQFYEQNVTVLARSAEGPPVAVLQETLRRIAPAVAATYVGEGAALTDTMSRISRAMAVIGNGLAAFALILSMAGLYGVLSHVVAKRMRELAVRIALGAGERRIVWLVLRDGLRPVVEGLALGLGGAIVLRQILRITTIKNLSPIDPAAFGLVTAILAIAALAACYAPARRASRVDPNVTLKES